MLTVDDIKRAFAYFSGKNLKVKKIIANPSCEQLLWDVGVPVEFNETVIDIKFIGEAIKIPIADEILYLRDFDQENFVQKRDIKCIRIWINEEIPDFIKSLIERKRTEFIVLIPPHLFNVRLPFIETIAFTYKTDVVLMNGGWQLAVVKSH